MGQFEPYVTLTYGEDPMERLDGALASLFHPQRLSSPARSPFLSRRCVWTISPPIQRLPSPPSGRNPRSRAAISTRAPSAAADQVATTRSRPSTGP
ncbi:MAG: hypothetical protein ACLRWQ_07060 [Flavonifractor plautii]